MTQKELLYMEDIFNHEQLLIGTINKITTEIDNDNYISLLSDNLKKHEALSKKILKVLEGVAK